MTSAKAREQIAKLVAEMPTEPIRKLRTSMTAEDGPA